MSDSPEKPELEIRFGRRRHIQGRPAPEVIFVETATHTLSLQISKYSDLHFFSGFFWLQNCGGIIFFVYKYHVCASIGQKCHCPNDGGSTDQTDGHNAVTNQFVMSSLPFLERSDLLLMTLSYMMPSEKLPWEEMVDIFKLLGNSQLWFDHVQKKRSRHDGTTVDLEKSCKIIQNHLCSYRL